MATNNNKPSSNEDSFKKKIDPLMNLNIKNVLGVSTIFGPFFLIGFLILLSCINNDIKVILYLSGFIFIYIATTLFNNNKDNLTIIDYKEFCNVLGYENKLSLNSTIYLYTFTYLLMPMIDKHNYNIGLLVFILILYSIDIISKIVKGCSNVKSILLGSLIGIVTGFILFTLFNTDQNLRQYLYYDTLSSNKIACLRPTKQKFKCNVLRNGEIITSIS